VISSPVAAGSSIWCSERRRHALKMALVYLTLAIGGAAVTTPFSWMVSTSLKAPKQVGILPPVWIPSPIGWPNQVDALTMTPLGAFPKNTDWRIILPFSMPALATGALFAFRFRWDELVEPLICLSSPRNHAVGLGLRFYRGQTGDHDQLAIVNGGLLRLEAARLGDILHRPAVLCVGGGCDRGQGIGAGCGRVRYFTICFSCGTGHPTRCSHA
jgi:ABC-type glycerol-3-phosphate transport system permease component